MITAENASHIMANIPRAWTAEETGQIVANMFCTTTSNETTNDTTLRTKNTPKCLCHIFLKTQSILIKIWYTIS